jgi:hypothetical protein
MARKLEFADHVSPEFIDAWPPLDHLLPLTSTVVDRVVVVHVWKWSLHVMAIFPTIILLANLPFFLLVGWLFFFGAVVAELAAAATMLLLFHLSCHGTLCMLSNDGQPTVNFPQNKKLILLKTTSNVDLVWVKATPNTYLRRIGVVVVQGTEMETRRSLSIPIFISYNKKKCHKALASIQEVLMGKP